MTADSQIPWPVRERYIFQCCFIEMYVLFYMKITSKMGRKTTFETTIVLDIKFTKKVHNLFKKVLHFSRGGVKMG